MIYNLERTLEEEFQKREARGEVKGEARMLIKLLKKKFAAVPEEYIEKIKKQDSEVLETIGKNILNMRDIKELDKYLKE
ncbi:MAG: hypothetical protein PWP48_1774 [Clostridiales bacterium]|nr:hypothetical protein [Clostridiales bacterium]MDK2992541.1 hypothetical protein [Clostridiales bacterium]